MAAPILWERAGDVEIESETQASAIVRTTGRPRKDFQRFLLCSRTTSGAGTDSAGEGRLQHLIRLAAEQRGSRSFTRWHPEIDPDRDRRHRKCFRNRNGTLLMLIILIAGIASSISRQAN